MDEYSQLKQRLEEIAELLKRFPEGLHQRVFDLLTAASGVPAAPGNKQPPEETPGKPAKVRDQKTVSGKPRSDQNPKRLPNLDLSHNGDNKAFEKLVEKKKPQNAGEFNTVALYYLIEVLKVANVTMDHIYTCYDAIHRKVPTAFAQSLRDTSSKLGFIDVSDWASIKMNLKGLNLVRHDLPATVPGGK